MKSTHAMPQVCDPLIGAWASMNAAAEQVGIGDFDEAAETFCDAIDLLAGISDRCVRIIGLLAKSRSATGPELGRVAQAISAETGQPAETVFSMITGDAR